MRKREAKVVIVHTRQYTSIGMGGSTSAMSGARMVENLEKTLHIPKICELMIEGK